MKRLLRSFIILDSGLTFQWAVRLGAGITMVPKMMVTSMLLWVNAMSLNLPYFWDPASQRWKINKNFGGHSVVYIVPESSKMTTSRPEAAPSSGKCDKYRINDGCDCCPGGDIVVIDTDGDADDAMAIVLLLNGLPNNTGISVAGITCTWGSTNIKSVVKNVVKTLKACDRFHEIAVYAGRDMGLVERRNIPCKFGDDAFGNFYYFPSVDDENICDEHPAIYLSTLVRENPGKVVIVCLGPLSNIAIAAHLYPDFYSNVKQILYLGGSENKNGTMNKNLATGEGVSWNDWLDPYAAKAVLGRSAEEDEDEPKITICPEELYARTTQFVKDERDNLDKKGTRVTELLRLAESVSREAGQGWECWSPILAAAVIDPKIVKDDVGVAQVDTTGLMVVRRPTETEIPNVRVIKSVDEARVLKLIHKYVG